METFCPQNTTTCTLCKDFSARKSAYEPAIIGSTRLTRPGMIFAH